MQRLLTTLALAAPAALFAGCSSPKYHAEYAQTLASSQQLMAQGDLTGANGQLTGMLETLRERGTQDYELQRFFAVHLLTEVHELAAYGNEFMTESTQAGVSLGNTTKKRPSTTGHVVASTYYAGRLLGLASGVDGAARTAGEVLLGPGRLESVDVSAATEYARFVLVAAYSRLGFSTPARELLADAPQFTSTSRRADVQAAEFLDELGVPTATRAWVYLEAFRMHCEQAELTPELAYRYGVRARASTREAPGSGTGLGEQDEVVNWAESLDGQFKSSKGTVFGPYTRVCEESGEAAIDFTYFRALP